MRRYFHSLLGISLGVAMSAAISAGCAANTQNTNNPKAGSKQASNKNMVCKREMVVGSHVPRTVCRDKSMADQERERDQLKIRDIQQRNYYVEQ